MPPGAVEAFTQTIQPLLVNRCATGGCHTPSPRGGFSLLRRAGRAGGQPTDHAAKPFRRARADQPREAGRKPLAPRAAGAARQRWRRLAGPEVSQYQQIADWVHYVAQPQPGNPPAPAAAASTALPVTHEQLVPSATPATAPVAAPTDGMVPATFDSPQGFTDDAGLEAPDGGQAITAERPDFGQASDEPSAAAVVTRPSAAPTSAN